MNASAWERTREGHRREQAARIATTALHVAMEGGAPALTMAGIAEAAGVSRPTLYRYYPDMEAVLTGIAEVVAAGDDDLAEVVAAAPDAQAALDVLARAVATAGAHDRPGTSNLAALLPPAARDVLTRHVSRVEGLLTDVLTRGIRDGSFHAGLTPGSDAPLILGLLAAASPEDPERAVTLVHKLVRANRQPQGEPR